MQRKNKKLVFVFLLICLILGKIHSLTGAQYLIITPDNYVPAVEPLAFWKNKKGIITKIIPLSQIGSSSSQIKNFIVTSYNTWDIRPAYVLLVGTTSLIPASGSSDDYYADVAGNYRIELSIGRIPCASIAQCQNIVNKILNYERNPQVSDSTWILKGSIIIREDGSSPPDNVYWENAYYIADFWRSYGYTQIDTFSRLAGHSSANVTNAINDGRMFVVYRGQAVSNWWSPFAITPENLTNGYKTPIVVSGTCQTLSLSDNTYLGNQFMNAGSITNSKGAVAFLGTTRTAGGSNLALNRGTVTKGIFQAIFNERIWYLGDALKCGKYLIDSLAPPNYTQERYTEWELFGDPTLEIWTDIPRRLFVAHDTIIPLGSQIFNVTVSENQFPLMGAKVCIMMDSTIYDTQFTDHMGNVSFNITPNYPGIMYVTVTAHNYIPYEGQVVVQMTSIEEIKIPDKFSKTGITFNVTPDLIYQLKPQINFKLSSPEEVALAIYNLEGKLIKSVFSGKILPDEVYNFNWDLLDDKNHPIPPGVYFSTLKTANHVLGRKLIIIR
jgi:hypothetical protein